MKMTKIETSVETSSLKKWETPILTNLSLGSDDVEAGTAVPSDGIDVPSS